MRVLSWQNELMQGLGYTGTALVAAGLLLIALERGWYDSSVLRFFGRYSYGIYVLHAPLIFGFTSLVRSWGPPPQLLGSQVPSELGFALVALGLSTAAALVSWVLIEQPFLKLKDRRPVPQEAV